MTNNPFSSIADADASSLSRRRSTRVEFVTPIFLSGRDAGGQPYRELTQTAIVNLHGCKLRTSYRVLVGMLVTLECPRTGMTGKAVCVRVWDPPAGVAGHEIAVQLVKPQNMWGMPNPPADWETVAKTMVQGRVMQGERPTRAPAPATPPPPPLPQPPPPAPPPKPVAPLRPSPVVSASIEQRLAELEQRSQQLVDSVLDILRSQAEELTRANLEVFRQQVEALVYDAERQLRKGIQQSFEESASSLVGLRTDLMEQLVSRSAQLIRSAEDSLRARFREMLSLQTRGAGSGQPPEPPSNK